MRAILSYLSLARAILSNLHFFLAPAWGRGLGRDGPAGRAAGPADGLR